MSLLLFASSRFCLPRELWGVGWGPTANRSAEVTHPVCYRCVHSKTETYCGQEVIWWLAGGNKALSLHPPHPSMTLLHPSRPPSTLIAGLIDSARFGNRLICVISHNKDWPLQMVAVKMERTFISTDTHRWSGLPAGTGKIYIYLATPDDTISVG